MPPPSPPSPLRFCRFCLKVFPSGRSLGGHMRIHSSSVSTNPNPLSKLSHSHRSESLFGPSSKNSIVTESDDDDDDALSERLTFASASLDHFDDERSEGQYFIEDRMIPTEYRRQHALSSLDFTSNHELRPDDELSLHDGMLNSGDERKHNLKRSQRSTDQEFAPDVLAPNTTVPQRAKACSECGKIFWSWKALFGHMRCHPEREWRGIHPPNSMERHSAVGKRSPEEYSFPDDSELEIESGVETAEAQEREASIEMVVEEGTSTEGALDAPNKQEMFNKIVGGEERTSIGKKRRRQSVNSKLREVTEFHWSTGKRSKRPRTRAPGFRETGTPEPELTSETTSNEDKNEDDFDTANSLCMLAVAGNMLEELERNRMESAEESDSGKNLRLQESERAWKVEIEADFDASLVDRKDVGANNSVKHECSTCGRRFNSHQALGGHIASHRKTEGYFARTKVTEQVRADNLTGEEIISSTKLGVPVAVEEKQSEDACTAKQMSSTKKQLKVHECSICHLVFPSGQALGGHKRRHWTGEKPTDTASVASSSNKQPSLPSAGQTKMLREHAIDLNLPAPVHEGDEGTTEHPVYDGTIADVSEAELKVGSWRDYSSKSKLNNVSRNWAVQDLLGGTENSLSGRFRFDARPERLGHFWFGAAQIPHLQAL